MPSLPGGPAIRTRSRWPNGCRPLVSLPGRCCEGPTCWTTGTPQSGGHSSPVDHPQVGPKQYPGLPWRMSGTPGEVRWPSPTLGQHNREIFGGLLGLTGDEIDDLENGGVIGTKPTGSRII